MGGKASLFMVAGFSMIFFIASMNFGTISSRAVDNMVEYNDQTVSHNIAVSAANMAANEIFLDNDWDDGFSPTNFSGGAFKVNVDVIDVFQNIRRITATGYFQGITSTVQVILSPSRFSKFAYYSEDEGGSIWWTENDTVWGPFHTQDYLRAYKHPVFYGKATSKKKIEYYNSKKQDEPIFYGGYEQGVDLELPSNGLDPLKTASKDKGLNIPKSSSTTSTPVWVCEHKKSNHTTQCSKGHWGSTISTSVDTVYITFVQDSIKISMGYNKPSTNYKSSSITNGVIYAEGMDVRLKGTVKGQFTVVSENNVFLDDDVVYSQDPRVHSNSTDILGIVAKNNVVITDNPANNKDINIHASIYCEKDGFGAENHDSRPVSGNINLLGGIIQHTRQAVGTFNSYGTTAGFNKRYRYDERLMISYPPFFPGTGKYEIVSWLE